jgi:hypothetical protein
MKIKREAIGSALYALAAMYLFFMILDRMLSAIFGFNSQPYGPYAPLGFALWGHLGNGSLALLGMWLLVKVWALVGRRRHPWVLRALALVAFVSIYLWIPYNNDANHLIKNGRGDAISLYVVANSLYVLIAGLSSLRLAASVRWKSALLGLLFLAFLLVHFVLYVPMFPDFQWT